MPWEDGVESESMSLDDSQGRVQIIKLWERSLGYPNCSQTKSRIRNPTVNVRIVRYVLNPITCFSTKTWDATSQLTTTSVRGT